MRPCHFCFPSRIQSPLWRTDELAAAALQSRAVIWYDPGGQVLDAPLLDIMR